MVTIFSGGKKNAEKWCELLTFHFYFSQDDCLSPVTFFSVYYLHPQVVYQGIQLWDHCGTGHRAYFLLFRVIAERWLEINEYYRPKENSHRHLMEITGTKDIGISFTGLDAKNTSYDKSKRHKASVGTRVLTLPIINSNILLIWMLDQDRINKGRIL